MGLLLRTFEMGFPPWSFWNGPLVNVVPIGLFSLKASCHEPFKIGYPPWAFLLNEPPVNIIFTLIHIIVNFVSKIMVNIVANVIVWGPISLSTVSSTFLPTLYNKIKYRQSLQDLRLDLASASHCQSDSVSHLHPHYRQFCQQDHGQEHYCQCHCLGGQSHCQLCLPHSCQHHTKIKYCQSLQDLRLDLASKSHRQSDSIRPFPTRNQNKTNNIDYCNLFTSLQKCQELTKTTLTSSPTVFTAPAVGVFLLCRLHLP